MVAYYESCAKNPTIEVVEKAAGVFAVAVGELAGNGGQGGGRKPGRTSHLERLTGELARLPKAKQRVVVQMLEGFLHQENTA